MFVYLSHCNVKLVALDIGCNWWIPTGKSKHVLFTMMGSLHSTESLDLARLQFSNQNGSLYCVNLQLMVHELSMICLITGHVTNAGKGDSLPLYQGSTMVHV